MYDHGIPMGDHGLSWLTVALPRMIMDGNDIPMGDHTMAFPRVAMAFP